MPFDESLRTKVLLWCDRHCCLCKKPCGVNIEVDHIVPESEGGASELDNALPLCFDCHSDAHRYNVEHPRGTKFKSDELKARREQVYEEFTRHLVPALTYNIHQGGRRLPDVGFTIGHLGDAPPVQVLVTLDTYVNGVLKNINDTDPVYRGRLKWNLNAKEGVNGHFKVCNAACQSGTDVRVGVRIVVHDCYDRPHNLLPVTYVYDREKNEWWLDPIDPIESAQRAKAAGGAETVP